MISWGEGRRLAAVEAGVVEEHLVGEESAQERPFTAVRVHGHPGAGFGDLDLCLERGRRGGLKGLGHGEVASCRSDEVCGVHSVRAKCSAAASVAKPTWGDWS